MTERVVAIVPARGGSKGIPRKNLYELAGKPLLQWTLEAAQGARCVSDVVVSSDDPEVLCVAEALGALTIVRPPELATDCAKTEPVLTHAIEVLRNKDLTYDVLLLLQPTSPLRTSADIDQAYHYWRDKHAQALISVQRQDKSPLKSFFVDEHGLMSGIVNDDYPFMPRQQLPSTYLANGAIYIVDMKLFLANGLLFQKETVAFEMNAKSSLDIDSYSDLELANFILTTG